MANICSGSIDDVLPDVCVLYNVVEMVVMMHYLYVARMMMSVFVIGDGDIPQRSAACIW